MKVGSDSWWPAHEILYSSPPQMFIRRCSCWVLCLGLGDKAQGSPIPSPNSSPLTYQPPTQIFMLIGLFFLDMEWGSSCILLIGSRAHNWKGIQTKIMILPCWNKPMPPQGSRVKQTYIPGWIQCGMSIYKTSYTFTVSPRAFDRQIRWKRVRKGWRVGEQNRKKRDRETHTEKMN